MRQEIEQALQAEQYEQAQDMLITWFAEQQKLFTTEPQPHAVNSFLSDLLKSLHQLLVEHHLANHSLEQAEAFWKEWEEKVAEFDKSLAASYTVFSHNQCCLANIQTHLPEIRNNFRNLCVLHAGDLTIRRLIIQQGHAIANSVMHTVNQSKEELLKIINNDIYFHVFQRSLLNDLSEIEQAEQYALIGKFYWDHQVCDEALAYYSQAFTMVEKVAENTSQKAHLVLDVAIQLNRIEFW